MVVVDKCGCIPGAGLLENMFAVASYGFVADEYFFSYLLVGITKHDESKDLYFAKCKFVIPDRQFIRMPEFFIDEEYGIFGIFNGDFKGKVKGYAVISYN